MDFMDYMDFIYGFICGFFNLNLDLYLNLLEFIIFIIY